MTPQGWLTWPCYVQGEGYTSDRVLPGYATRALGYPQARELLKDRFGDEVIIVDMWVKRLVVDTKALPLQEYVDNLRACFSALTSMNALAHLDNSTNLPKLVEKLPGYLQSRWCSLALKLRKEKPSRWPALCDLVEFAQDAALEANDPLYSIKPKKPAQSVTVRGTSLATSAVPTAPSQSPPRALEGRPRNAQCAREDTLQLSAARCAGWGLANVQPR